MGSSFISTHVEGARLGEVAERLNGWVTKRFIGQVTSRKRLQLYCRVLLVAACCCALVFALRPSTVRRSNLTAGARPCHTLSLCHMPTRTQLGRVILGAQGLRRLKS